MCVFIGFFNFFPVASTRVNNSYFTCLHVLVVTVENQRKLNDIKYHKDRLRMSEMLSFPWLGMDRRTASPTATDGT